MSSSRKWFSTSFRRFINWPDQFIWCSQLTPINFGVWCKFDCDVTCLYVQSTRPNKYEITIFFTEMCLLNGGKSNRWYAIHLTSIVSINSNLWQLDWQNLNFSWNKKLYFFIVNWENILQSIYVITVTHAKEVWP